MAAQVQWQDVMDAMGEIGLLARLLMQHSYGAVKGFSRYLCLLHHKPEQSAEFSPEPDVDAAWHTAVLNTREYQSLCERCFGEMIHHSTATAADSEPEKKRRRLEATKSMAAMAAPRNQPSSASTAAFGISLRSSNVLHQPAIHLRKTLTFPFDQNLEDKDVTKTWPGHTAWEFITLDFKRLLKSTASQALGIAMGAVSITDFADARIIANCPHSIEAWQTVPPRQKVRIHITYLSAAGKMQHYAASLKAPVKFDKLRKQMGTLMGVAKAKVTIVGKQGKRIGDDESVTDLSRVYGWASRTGSMEVFVRTLCGKTHTLELRGQDTVETAKMIVRALSGVPMDQQRLIFAGKQLEDARTLQECGIQKQSVISLVLRLGGC